MADDETTPRDNEPPPRGCPCRVGEIPIRDFPDLRKLRTSYLRGAEEPVHNQVPAADETDFGLTRSTLEEAGRFLEDALNPDPDNLEDALTEFLDDDDDLQG